jgi:hypothetical protein
VTTEQSPPPQTASAAESSQLIEFERADVISPMIYPARPRLVVSGRQPWANMTVSLVPRHYVAPPDYWAIEVIGTMPQIGQPAIVPYVVELDLGGTIGSVGVEVVGADKTERIDVQAPDDPAVAAEPGGPSGTGTAEAAG